MSTTVIALPSYKIKSCCSADCWALAQDKGPCWGEVSAIDEIEGDEDWFWVHSCEGHYDMYDSYATSDPQYTHSYYDEDQ